MVEASATSPEGRISPGDMGIWNDEQAAALGRIAKFIRAHGAVPAIQLAHAGRKASHSVPWEGDHAIGPDKGGWQTVAPSAVPFAEGDPAPRALSIEECRTIIGDFNKAIVRAVDAGFEVIELHMAHGYLLHQFLSPLSNNRADKYGGDLEGRMRFPLEVAAAARKTLPAKFPLFVRISATDWADGGWDLAQSIELCKRLKDLGVDLIDCSTGGLVPKVKIPVGPGYQVQFAEAVRKDTGLPTGAVGMITEAQQAETILANEQADVVFLAREFLRDAYFPLHAAKVLGVDLAWPKQYERAKPREHAR